MKHRIKMSSSIRKRLEAFGFGEPSPEQKMPVQERSADLSEEGHEADGQNGKALITVASRTDVGRVRQSNQDTLILGDCFYGVADGMGGHKGGEVASAALRDSLMNQLKGKEPAGGTLHNAVKIANRRLFIRAQEDQSLQGMGTTLDLLWFGKDAVYIAHVGDSRVYRLRDGELVQITSDHSMVMEMVRAGMITEEQAAVHPMRNIITRAVGTENTLEVDILTEERRPGDVWLVCSDGLHGMVKDAVLCDLLTRYAPEPAADELLSAALEAGGHDNVSLVIVQDREGA